MISPPAVDSYWVVRKALLAGEYPGHWDDEEALERIAFLLDHGVTTFFDLTMEDEGLHPYTGLLALEAAYRGIEVQYRRFAIPDHTAPSPELAIEIVESLEAALDEGKVVYLHCYAGIGRTGTIVGIWLVRNRRISGADAMREIARLRRKVRYAMYESPEVPEQVDLLCNWPQSE